MGKILGLEQVRATKHKVLEFDGAWRAAFGRPARTGTWLIWGSSNSGKTRFALQLCKYLCRFGRVAYDSLEEGFSLSMANTLERFGLAEANGRVSIDCCPVAELSEKMSRRKSADIWVIDSFQYSQLSYKEYIRFKERHPDKLVVFVSQADGKKPAGRAAASVMYDSALKVWVEGFRAFSKGRYIGEKGYYTVWEDGARRYWGEKEGTNNDKK